MARNVLSERKRFHLFHGATTCSAAPARQKYAWKMDCSRAEYAGFVNADGMNGSSSVPVALLKQAVSCSVLSMS